jgi:hypothetical protein
MKDISQLHQTSSINKYTCFSIPKVKAHFSFYDIDKVSKFPCQTEKNEAWLQFLWMIFNLVSFVFNLINIIKRLK